ncbi:hypothetical protein [Archangium sp.]|uniref:hypothetical protein n=1 Tax=Archangium sp. TaxID=1872627 RepID=UPI002D34DD0D|nr:hypothetical protein [Archangium sp.]HYO53156.1 hypothetical protein [Archangium sp.]
MAPQRRPHGQVRQSQVITTFGPGAMVDLPRHAVIIGGLECWGQPGRQIHEERLEARLRADLEIPGLTLHAPPVDDPSVDEAATGITAWRFPQWFVAQYEVKYRSGDRSRPLVHARALIQDKYVEDRKKYDVQPVRWVQACPRGHINDVDWIAFVHKNQATCRRQLWLDERGTTGE